ncbi:MAG: hypothetical protein IKJ33_00090 [Clostridia bacterium]|nr:hypothetical protein [Clostridia bacterium]
MFGRKIEKESNVAHTPEESRKSPIKRINTFFFLLTFFSIALYSCYTFFIIYKLTEKTFLSKIIMYLLAIYVVVFVLLVLVNLGNRRRMKKNLKNYKSATKFLKYTVQLINLVLSIVTAISALITTGTTDISAIAYAILSMFVTFIFIFIEIITLKIRKNFSAIKQNFFELREKPPKTRQ